jgi:hypothetical protein
MKLLKMPKNIASERERSKNILVNMTLFVFILSILLNCDATTQNSIDDAARQYRENQENHSEFVVEPSASSIFSTDNSKWCPLEIGNGKKVVKNGKITWLVELRGWLSAVGTSCNGNDPDWHYSLEVDPDWADSAGMPLTQLLRAGNFINDISNEQIGDMKLRRIVGTPNVVVELNGYVPSKNNELPAPTSWNTFNQDCKDTNRNETAVWAFNPIKPLSWQKPLEAGDYVRIYGALVTDGPHTSEGLFPQFFCRQFNLACDADNATEQRLALVRWGGNRNDDDSTNQARWTEMHPPDIIAILPQKARTNTFRSVAVSAENCLVGPCEKTILDFAIDAPQFKPTNANGIVFREEVIPATNFRTITEGKSNTASGFDGATITETPTGVLIHVAVQGQPGYGAHGRFGALYRVSWKTN